MIAQTIIRIAIGIALIVRPEVFLSIDDPGNSNGALIFGDAVEQRVELDGEDGVRTPRIPRIPGITPHRVRSLKRYSRS